MGATKTYLISPREEGKELSLIQEHQADDAPAPLQPLREQWQRLAKYRATRKAVRKGTPVWELSANQLKTQGLAGPWEQELLESAFAALPAIILLKVMNFLFVERAEIANARATLPELVRIRADTFQYLVPVVAPLSLLAVVLIAARASLKRSDITPEKLRVARRAYLYLDGSYGLFPQAIISLALTALGVVIERAVPGNREVMVLVLIGIWQVVSFVQLWIIGRTIPRRLFEANGYGTEVPHFWSKSKEKNYGPWSKYTLGIIILGPLVVFSVLALAFGAAHLWALITIWVHSLTRSS